MITAHTAVGLVTKRAPPGEERVNFNCVSHSLVAIKVTLRPIFLMQWQLSVHIMATGPAEPNVDHL